MGMLHKVKDAWKQKSFNYELKSELDMHSEGNLVMCFG